MIHFLSEAAIPVGLVVLLWCFCAAGARFAHRVKLRTQDLGSIGVVQGALLGLLALLLGFSFSSAMARFATREELLVGEANAVGTAWLRADILPPAERERMREALRRYTDKRIELFNEIRSSARETHIKELEAAYEQVWKIGVAAVNAQPQMAVAVLPPLNEISDLLSAQRAAHNRHLPNLVMVVLLACACGSVAAVGFGMVFVERRTHLPAIVLILLITASLWLIIDMDYPKLGLIRISEQPLTDMREAMK